MNLSKELKKKRDAEDRLRQTSPQVIFSDNGTSQDFSSPSNFLTKAVTKLNNLFGDVALVAGDNIVITVNGQNLIISSLGGDDVTQEDINYLQKQIDDVIAMIAEQCIVTVSTSDSRTVAGQIITLTNITDTTTETYTLLTGETAHTFRIEEGKTYKISVNTMGGLYTTPSETTDFIAAAGIIRNVSMLYISTSIMYLYNIGDECADMTGTWFNDYSGGTGSFVKESGYLLLTASSQYASRVASTTNKIALAGISKLYIDMEFGGTATKGDSWLLVSSANKVSAGTNRVAGFNIVAIGRAIYELDVSTLNDTYYIRVSCYTNSPSHSVKVYKVWGE